MSRKFLTCAASMVFVLMATVQETDACSILPLPHGRSAEAVARSTGVGTGHGAEQRSRRADTELQALQQELAKAWVNGDRATIERIIASDWRFTGPDGRMTGRAAVLTDVFETRRHKILRIEIDDVTVRVFGDAAVVTGRTHGVGEVEGSPYDVVIRFTDTFVRRDGRWQAVASHASLAASGNEASQPLRMSSTSRPETIRVARVIIQNLPTALAEQLVKKKGSSSCRLHQW